MTTQAVSEPDHKDYIKSVVDKIELPNFDIVHLTILKLNIAF